MKRREFLCQSTFGAVGLGALARAGSSEHGTIAGAWSGPRSHPKNIIFVVSDGMSAGTLQLAELYANVKYGQTTCWADLYRQNRVSQALMETYSANSWVTDSAAASSAWGGGVRVKNGSLNVGPNGEQYVPILQKFQQQDFAVGCVTSVPITHATPAGFCVNHADRGEQAQIAEMYLRLRFDCMLGGGIEYFSAESRSDKQDLLGTFKQAGYHVATTKLNLTEISADNQPVLGCFHKSGIPYALDHAQDEALLASVPSLADMAKFAIERLSRNPRGFVLQIEGGKVDWAAHANDTTALIYDQLAVDAALKVAIEFAESSQETLVIVTTDHGNANPGLLGTGNANKKFESLINVRHTNTWVMDGLKSNWGIDEIRQRVQFAQGLELTADEAKQLHEHIAALSESDRGEARKLPFAKLANMQKQRTGIGWAGDDHCADYVELAMFGPGSEQLPQFVKNTDLHQFMLDVAGVLS